MNRSLPLHVRSGFTLIELLVVIAIIGTLSSIVLASLNNARAKGTDAKIKSQMSGVRAAAELYYTDTSFTYGAAVAGTEAIGASVGPGCATAMFADSKLSPYLLLINNPSYSNAGKCTTTGANATGYTISAKLNAASTYWCVDGKGNSRLTGSLPANFADTCP